MEYGEDDVHPLYTFRGDLRLNRAGCDSIIFLTSDTIEMRVWREKIGPNKALPGKGNDSSQLDLFGVNCSSSCGRIYCWRGRGRRRYVCGV